MTFKCVVNNFRNLSTSYWRTFTPIDSAHIFLASGSSIGTPSVVADLPLGSEMFPVDEVLPIELEEEPKLALTVADMARGEGAFCDWTTSFARYLKV